MRTRTTLKRSRVLDPQEQIPWPFRAAYLMFHRQSDAAFAPYGVTADQFVLLARLSEGESLTQKEFAIRMPSDPSTVRTMLVCCKSGDWFVETLIPQTAGLERRH